MSLAANAIAIGTLGAALQELLFWYNAKTRLSTEEYNAILKSRRYWVVVVAMVVGSGAASYYWFAPDQQTARTYLLFGAGFPVLFKKAVDAFIPTQTHLGARGGAQPKVLRNYFRVV